MPRQDRNKETLRSVTVGRREPLRESARERRERLSRLDVPREQRRLIRRPRF